MIASGMFNGIGTAIYGGMIAIVILILVGIYETYDYFFNEEVIITEQPIEPEIQLTIKENNVIDTLYIYRKP